MIFSDLKLVYFLPLLLIFLIPQAFGEEFNIEFSESTSFVKGDFVGIHSNGVNFDSRDQITGIVLDNTGNQIDTFQSEIQRYTDVGDQGSGIFQTNNQKYQTDTLYTVKATYQGQESQLQFTLTEPPPTVEELSIMIQSQELEVSSELETLRNENSQLREQISELSLQITTLTEQINNLTLIIQEQINVMMQFFQ